MLIFVFVIIFGLCFGSFANVLIFRIPLGLNIALPGSFCPHCKRGLKWGELIPIFSFIFLKAKCKSCKNKIPFIYVFSEILGGILALICFLEFSYFGLVLFLFLLNFYVLSVIDVRILAVPDSLNFLGFFLALGCFFMFDKTLFESLLDGLIFLGFASFLRLFVGSVLDKEVLGEGDLVIFASIGALFSTLNAFVAIFLSAIFALLFLVIYYFRYKKMLQAPFVPFLFLGTICVLGQKYFF
ncbi:MAG: prepilin peptidase [Helicobacter sp.]|nr:prepilin peptidase [Helicobacteraceae bacterium]MDY3112867.1 prepilin peptidase [Helicobacter sp.]